MPKWLSVCRGFSWHRYFALAPLDKYPTGLTEYGGLPLYGKKYLSKLNS